MNEQSSTICDSFLIKLDLVSLEVGWDFKMLTHFLEHLNLEKWKFVFKCHFAKVVGITVCLTPISNCTATLAFSSICSSVRSVSEEYSSASSSGSAPSLEVSLPSDCFLWESRKKNPWIWSFESHSTLLKIRVPSVSRVLRISLATCAGSFFLPVFYQIHLVYLFSLFFFLCCFFRKISYFRRLYANLYFINTKEWPFHK